MTASQLPTEWIVAARAIADVAHLEFPWERMDWLAEQLAVLVGSPDAAMAFIAEYQAERKRLYRLDVS